MNQASLPVSALPNGPRFYLCKPCNGTGQKSGKGDDKKIEPSSTRRGDCKSCGGLGEVLECRR